MSAFLLDFFLGGLLWQPQSFPPKIFYQNIEEILLREKANREYLDMLQLTLISSLIIWLEDCIRTVAVKHRGK